MMKAARRLLAGAGLVVSLTAFLLVAAAPAYASPAEERSPAAESSIASASSAAPAALPAPELFLGDQATSSRIPFTHLDLSVFVVGAIGVVVFATLTPRVLLRRVRREFVGSPALGHQLQETGLRA